MKSPNALTNNGKKNFQQVVSKIVKKYFKGIYAKDKNVFEELAKKAESFDLTKTDVDCLQKLSQVFFLGQLVGLPTLNSILNRFGIKSNNIQIKYKSICNRLSNKNLHKIFESIFEQQLSEKLKTLCGKDASNWSRVLVTAVLDDSVFKQWLQSNTPEIDFDQTYGRFFSGQIGRVVYGFQVVTFGLSIDGIFYPLYFECVKKKQEGEKSEKQSIEVAKKLILKWGKFVCAMKNQEINLPEINFSCDSGYSDVSLSETCLENKLNYISVPKKNHNFIIEDKTTNLHDWIENTFKVQEKIHFELEKDKKKEEKTPFTIRIKAYYQCQKRIVTLLVFRLNNSNKVSAIYSTDKNIKEKTLRRHWFQRTNIEQFFKLLKHYLHIQQTITKTKHKFEFKLLRFSFVALHIQLLVKFVRRKLNGYKKNGFGLIRTLLQSDQVILGLLESFLK